jgi:hypothetical protein
VPQARRLRGGGRRLACLVAATLLAGGCAETTQYFDIPGYILRRAPRQCPAGHVLEPKIGPDELPVALRGHLPHWLPFGFGVAVAFAAESGDNAGATWSDRRCRQVQVGINFTSSPFNPPSGHRVGAWILTSDAPHGCFNAVLGKARCLTYLARLSPQGSVGFQSIGLNRRQANKIALSIPLEARFW